MHTPSWYLSGKKNDNNWKECGIFCLCLPQGSLIEQNYIKNSVQQLLKSSSTFYMKFFVIISRLLKKKNMKYPIHFFATFPRNFIKTVTDWGEVPWLSKDFCSCYKIIRHERSMLFIAWLVFFLSFSFRSWDEGAKCSLPEVHRQKRWLFMPQVMVWDIHEVTNSLNSFLLVTLW